MREMPGSEMQRYEMRQFGKEVITSNDVVLHDALATAERVASSE